MVVPSTISDVVVERVIRATPDRVFRALTVASELEKWFFTEARTDPRTGGAYHITWKSDDGAPHRQHSRHGKYLEIVPNRRVTFEWIGAPDERTDQPYSLRGTRTVVTITLTPEGDGTRLRLVHSGFPDTDHGRDLAASHTKGWTFFAGNLDAYLNGGPDQRPEMQRQKYQCG